jgi:hypothetical protein
MPEQAAGEGLAGMGFMTTLGRSYRTTNGCRPRTG